MKGLLFVALVGWLGVIVAAQDVVVQPVPDAISWGTAFVNPTIAVIRAIRSDDPTCQLAQLAVTGGLAATGFLAQHFITSPRPCRGAPGCSGNGMPSMHAVWANVGVTRGVHSGLGVSVSVTMAVSTPALRWEAYRHTGWQAVTGALWGVGADLGGQALIRCKT